MVRLVIETVGYTDPVLWAAADVTGCELYTRASGKTSVYAAGYKVVEDLKWSSYEDLVSQLKVLNNHESIKAGYMMPESLNIEDKCIKWKGLA